jgi:hypothetical protein
MTERSFIPHRGPIPAALMACIIAVAAAGPAKAQVNTEALRGKDVVQGFQTSLEGRFTWVAGNSEFTKVNGLSRVDYLRGRYHGFLVGNYELGRQDDETFIHNGFAHLRNVVDLLPRTALELFAQLEFNEFLLLRQRRLLGAGFRYSLAAAPAPVDSGFRGQAHLGLGLMHEHEELDLDAGDGDEESSVIRATSYVNLRMDLNDKVAAHAVAYYQPRVDDAEDYRILGQAGLSVKLYRDLSLEMAVKGRYDSQPTADLESYDVEAVNGLRITF